MELRLLAWIGTLCAVAVAWPALRDRHREAMAFHRYRSEVRRWRQRPVELHIDPAMLRSVLDVTRGP